MDFMRIETERLIIFGIVSDPNKPEGLGYWRRMVLESQDEAR